MTFVQRQISVSFSMAQGVFEGGGNTATFSAISNAGPITNAATNPNEPRISARIDGPGGEVGITLEATIWGMPLSLMNQLSVVGTQVNYVYQNSVSISAGDAVSGMQLVFQGNIISAFVDAQSQPQVAFRVQATGSGLINAKSAPPTSVKGAADVSQIFGQLAQSAGLQFENQGVSVKLRNPYLPGSVGNQIKALARMAGVEHIIDRGKLSVWMPDSGTAGNLTISPQTGLVGYPTFNRASVIVRTIFNPTIRNNQTITIQSQLTPANGNWSVFHLTHEIESNLPKGKWFSVIQAAPIQSGGGNNTNVPSN